MFPTGTGKLNRKLDCVLRRIWKRVEIDGAHARRLRDTFAVGSWAEGATVYGVSKLMGTTEAVCEKHYAPPHVRELQERGRRGVCGLALTPRTTGVQRTI